MLNKLFFVYWLVYATIINKTAVDAISHNKNSFVFLVIRLTQ